MNIEEECCACGDPDYGVFGDVTNCQCPCHYPRVELPSPQRQAEIARHRRQRENHERISREFNSHMIHLFNEGQRK